MPRKKPRRSKTKAPLVTTWSDDKVSGVRRTQPQGSTWYLPMALPILAAAGMFMITAANEIPFNKRFLGWVIALGVSLALGLVAQPHLEQSNPPLLLVKPGWWRRPFAPWRPISRVVGVRTAYRAVVVSYVDDRGHLQDAVVCWLDPKEGAAFRDEVASSVNEALNANREQLAPRLFVNWSRDVARDIEVQVKPSKRAKSRKNLVRKWRVFSEDTDSAHDAGYREQSTPAAVRLTLAPAAGFWSRVRSWFTKPAPSIELWLPRSKIENTKFIAEKSEHRWHVRPQDNEQAPIIQDLTHEEAKELVSILKRER